MFLVSPEVWVSREVFQATLILDCLKKVIASKRSENSNFKAPSVLLPNPRKSREIKQPRQVGGCRVNTVFCNPAACCWTDTPSPCSCNSINTRTLVFATFVIDWEGALCCTIWLHVLVQGLNYGVKIEYTEQESRAVRNPTPPTRQQHFDKGVQPCVR